MTRSERLLWQRLQRRVSVLQPDIARAIIEAFEIIRKAITEAQFEALLARPDVLDGLNALQLLDEALLNRAFGPLRQALFQQTSQGVAYYARGIPGLGQTYVAFDVLNPRMVDGVRVLDTKVMRALTDSVRATVRQVVERGIIDGVNPREIARELRASIGLGPTQEASVRNFRQALLDRDVAKVKTYTLRDRRFDSRIARGAYDDADIDRWTDIYRRRRIAQNAETIARTATLDAQRRAQHLAWEGAIDNGVVGRSTLMKRWVGTLDSRERPTHVAMEGETVGFDEPFSNGQSLPGDTEYNCRCIVRYSTNITRQPASRKQAAVRQSARRRKNTPSAPAVPARPPTAAQVAATREAALVAHEVTIAAQPVEYAFAVAADGTEVLRKSGRQSEVSFTTAECRRLKDAHMTHNHPGGTWGFSPEDGQFALGNDLAEIRAVTTLRLSSLKRPPGGWQRTPAELSRAIRQADAEVRRLLTPQINAGTLTVDEAQRYHYHEVWIRVARALGWDYSSTPRATP